MPGDRSSCAHMDWVGGVPTRVGIFALGLGLAAGILFICFPEIDLRVSHLFYAGDGKFAGQSKGWVKVLRFAFLGAFYSFIAATLMGLIVTWRGARKWLRLAFPQWVFLAICLTAGPGLVANVVFKDHWGRARPKQVIEFGGKKVFTPPLMPTDQCGSNCSFVSGEAASVFLPFYAVGLVLPQSAMLFLAAGTVCGLIAGLVRVAQGAHFLSDVIYAGIFMAMTTVLVHWAVFGLQPATKRAADTQVLD